MVERQLTSSPTPLLVTDLDGTYLKGNSLHLFAKCALVDALHHLHLLSFAKICTALLARRLRLLSHISMKNKILAAAVLTPSLRHLFEQRVKAMISPEATRIIAHYRDMGYSVLLATAASAIYVPWIWTGDWIATPSLSGVECRGDEKKRQALDYAHRCNMIIRVAMTDHFDDLPLLSIPTLTNRYLLSPSADSIALIEASGIEAEIIRERD